MLNQYPLWKYLLMLGVVALGVFYAAPNLYAPDPALQISGESSSQVIEAKDLARAGDSLTEAGIDFFGSEVGINGRNALIRLRSREDQLPAQRVVQRALGDSYVVALNLAQTTPDWLDSATASPACNACAASSSLAVGYPNRIRMPSPK